jgi:hypothetical protein
LVENLPQGPDRLHVTTASGLVEYVRARDLYALRGRSPAPEQAARLELEQGELRVFEGTPPSGVPDEDLAAVYRVGARGPLAVPTGSILLRFRAGVNPEDHASEIEAAGFTITRRLGYAPHCAWVRPRTHRVRDALEHFDALRAVGEVEAVEPQMLLARQLR